MVASADSLSIALLIESDGPGGAERLLIQTAEELRRRGHRVLPVGPAHGCGWLAAQLEAVGFETATFALRSAIDPRCVTRLVRLLRDRHIDVVHSHEFTMAVYGAAATSYLRVPHIVTMHGGGRFKQRWRRRAALRWAIRNSAAVVAVSGATQRDLVQSLGVDDDAITLIANGIQPLEGEPTRVRRELQIQADELLILAVGNLYPVKGHRVLLDALSRLSRDAASQQWRLAIAGRGEEEESLRTLARESGIGDRVHLLGAREDIGDVLSAADVFVMPSLSEGLPLALLEAMFASKPIIASAIGGIPEVVGDGSEALLTPPGESRALASALRTLLAEPQTRTRLGVAARQRADAMFSLDALVDAYESLYRKGTRAQTAV